MDDRSIGLFGSLSVRLAGSQTPSTTPSRIAGIRNEVPYAKGTCNEREVKSIIERVRDGKKSTARRDIISGEATIRAKYRDSGKED